ncbi:ABC-2 type transport system ATP-binding protein [Thermodesulfobium acidiphilum]|uniref:ABC-2 type transport system ATP-binding protein n=1 Tax=Thermodesulfobium acidiphilum TaxID=1794699 RepID=A0A2R4W223_THEAF|nr:ABC transporter ATP-binding protein [Thermodesulfobium acidiphilum]AWB10859.1 ABC-2 type transport system ATP-binding protein [Thermodesulfobium acidiphilum]
MAFDVENVIEVENLTKKFGNFIAVDNISFSIKKGTVFGFLGPNGAGKTTTIKLILGLINKTSGKIKIFGEDIEKFSKERLGYMSQKFSLYHDLKVFENMIFYGSIYGYSRKDLEKRIDFLLEQYHLKEVKNTMVRDIGGLRQRVAFCTAILHNPDILVLDEPTSGVDPDARINFWDAIYSYAREGKTVLVTTHYMDEAEFCNQIGFIISGKLKFVGTPNSAKKIYFENSNKVGNLEDAFLWFMEN